MRPGFTVPDRYRVVGPLGSGACGTAWDAVDADGSACVLKVVFPRQPQRAVRLKTEAEVLRALSHPGIVRVRRLHDAPGAVILALEPAPGVGVLRWARSAGVIDRPFEVVASRVLSVARQLVDAVAAVHDAGWIHRDVKPDNARVDARDTLTLLDLDLAVPEGAAATPGGIVGTTAYRAPEQGLGLPAGPPADWFGVGVVLFEVLTGRRPYAASARAALRGKRRSTPPDVRRLRPEVPAALAEAVASLLHREPTARPTASELQAVLSELQAVLGGTMPWVSVPPASVPHQAEAAGVIGGTLFGEDDRYSGALDVLWTPVIAHLRRVARPVRLAVLPRDTAALCAAWPDFGALPELSAPVSSSKGRSRQSGAVGTPGPRAIAAARELMDRLPEAGIAHLRLAGASHLTVADARLLAHLFGAPQPSVSLELSGDDPPDPQVDSALDHVVLSCPGVRRSRSAGR